MYFDENKYFCFTKKIVSNLLLDFLITNKGCGKAVNNIFLKALKPIKKNSIRSVD